MVSALALAAIACGKLPAKDPGHRVLSSMPNSQACLDGATARIERYARGEVTEAEWAETWDCALNSIALFRRYVQPSTPEGYSPEDLRAFANKFLIHAVPVTSEAIDATFALKTALFGGARDTLRPEEFDRLQSFIVAARAASLDLIPHLAARARAPSPQALLGLSDAFARAGATLGTALETRGNPALPLSSLETLVRELAKGAHLELPANFAEQLSAAKLMLLAGDATRIEPEAWSSVLRLIGEYSGGLVAAMTATKIGNSRLEAALQSGDWSVFWGGLVERLRSPVNLTLRQHRGAMPLATIDGLIDALPDKWLRKTLGVPDGRVFDRAVLKKTLRPIARKLLGSRRDGELDEAAAKGMFDKWQEWQRGDALLSRIFAEGRLDPASTTRAAFRRAAEALGESRDAARLIALSDSYETLFKAGDAQLTYGLGELQTLDHLRNLHAIELVTQALMQAYASGPDSAAKVSDLQALLADYQDLGFALGYINPNVPQLADKRFREIDLFMLASDGNGLADIREVTYYLMAFLSTRTLTNRVRENAEAGCPTDLGVDPMGWRWIEPTCFRGQYFKERGALWDHFPALSGYYDNLNSVTRAKLEQAIEGAARDGANLSTPFASVDTVGFAGIIHYVEGLLARFDANHDGAINLAESRAAFPVYRRALSELSVIPLHDKATLEAIFTYILKRSRPPNKTLLGVADFLWWRAQTPFWKFNCDRACLYKVFGSLKVPAEKDYSTDRGW